MQIHASKKNDWFYKAQSPLINFEVYLFFLQIHNYFATRMKSQ